LLLDKDVSDPIRTMSTQFVGDGRTVSLITLHRVLNFGSVLQAYALSTTLERMGYSVELIDYWRPHDRVWHQILEPAKDPSLPPLRRALRVSYKAVEVVRTRKTFDAFLSKSLRLTRRSYKTFEELQEDPPSADIYMTGSDQVWNCIHNRGVDKAYYLGFAGSNSRRIAYAASFGVDRLDDGDVAATRDLVSELGPVSVREDTAIDIMQHLGRPDATHVVDPTLLLDGIEWRNFADKLSLLEPYLLVYSVEPRAVWEQVMDCARQVASALGLRIFQVTPGWFRQRFSGCDRLFSNATPQEFLALMAGASFTVVSSFHGTAFAINLNKQFVAVSPGQYGTRVLSLLRLAGLTQRLSGGEFDLAAALQPIDYQSVNHALSTARGRSLEFLSNALHR